MKLPAEPSGACGLQKTFSRGMETTLAFIVGFLLPLGLLEFVFLIRDAPGRHSNSERTRSRAASGALVAHDHMVKQIAP
jgi:hypothetical protein